MAGEGKGGGRMTNKGRRESDEGNEERCGEGGNAYYRATELTLVTIIKAATGFAWVCCQKVQLMAFEDESIWYELRSREVTF